MGSLVIPLRGHATAVRLRGDLRRNVWLLTDIAEGVRRDGEAVLFGAGAPLPDGLPLCILAAGADFEATSAENVVQLPPELSYLGPGDIVWLSPDASRIAVLWRASSRQNSVLLTERCDNYCLMCSQPPKRTDDAWLLERAFELVRLIPSDAESLIFTGGEPTLYGDQFVNLLRLCKSKLPSTDIHILSNGRRFSDLDFALNYSSVDNERMMVGIPVYGSEPSLHDYIVQAQGAFDETVSGIINLARLEQRVEVRVVVHKQTAPYLVEIAEFIARNLPFVEQVAIMGLEVIGLARANLNEVWIDPVEYKGALTEATFVLHRARIRTMIYNHQLCTIEPQARPFAVKSISDWKNEYLEICSECVLRSECGGFFHSSKYQSSSGIHPVQRVPATSAR